MGIHLAIEQVAIDNGRGKFDGIIKKLRRIQEGL